MAKKEGHIFDKLRPVVIIHNFLFMAILNQRTNIWNWYNVRINENDVCETLKENVKFVKLWHSLYVFPYKMQFHPTMFRYMGWQSLRAMVSVEAQWTNSPLSNWWLSSGDWI